VVSAQRGHHRPVTVIQEEEPLQVRLRHRVAVAAERRGLVIGQEFHRHRRKLWPTRQ